MTPGVTAPVTGLTEEQFSAFFEEIHGWTPFPWQQELLHRVLERGWPPLIDVPTGLGKTAVLDIAVYAAALTSEHSRRRVFLVVDRRLIVDQAHEHAACIQQALADAAPGTVCHAVAARLAAEGDDGPMLDVTRMRGGVNWSWLWLERPDRHAIITGTIDQIGSRLLFRGYGVGQRLWPVDAALAGTDSLIIVDEAHLSDAFLSTLSDVSRLETACTGPGPVVVAMSASPGGHNPDTHRISSADEHDPVAGPRLTAPKRLHLVTVPAAKEAARDAVAEALTYWARQLGGPGRVTGVVANTVAMARAVFGRLQAEVPQPARCVLLTGRIRPVDREYLLHDWYPRMRAGASRDSGEPVYVVATQTIEVGADIDLDALVTESAAFPGLIQRLGRVNRRGNQARAVTVAVHADALEDRVYGEARQQTWQWLTSIADPLRHRAGRSVKDLGRGIDASPAALRRRLRSLAGPDLEAMCGIRPYAPLVTAVTLDTWARTSPVPHPDIPVAPYLHGIGASEPTISMVWRADASGDDPQQWRRSTDRLPPSTDEAIELPIGAVRRWLASLPGAGLRRDRQASAQATAAETISDAESHPADGSGDTAANGGAGATSRLILRYGGPDGGEPVAAGQVRPGDLLVVPAAWGGCDRYGWNPASTTPVTDLADLVGGGRRGPAAVRVGPTLARAIGSVASDLAEPIRQLIAQITADLEDDTPDITLYRTMLSQMLPARAPGDTGADLPHERVLRRLAHAGRLTDLDPAVGGGKATAVLSDAGAAWNDDASAAGTSADSAARPITLIAHQAAVRDRAGQFARNLGLPEPLTQAVMLAAARHDEGKRDPRFQLMLHRGDRWQAAAAAAPLAKSGMDPADRAAFRRAQQLAGYPPGMRHEALSARITAMLLAHAAEPAGTAPAAGNGTAAAGTALADVAAEAAGADPDLIIHLVASHHGYARPLLPPIADPAPLDIEVSPDGIVFGKLSSADVIDWDSPARFARLCERYGRWGLAMLESIVRLADIWCSARSEESS
jgi:CRISPR-associated endonuclease/helicase Cas3